MKKTFLLFSVLICFLNNCLTWSQASYPEAKVFTVNDGLSQSQINTIIQDSRGFLWVGTEDGLNRYDGYNFISYTHQPFDNNSLSDNHINAICEDANGILWIATNRGLNSFEIKSGIFSNFQYQSDSKGLVSDNIVLNVFIDSKNTIWVKTPKSLYSFNSKTKSFHSYSHFNDIFKYSSIRIKYPILEDKKGRLWVGTKDGLNFFDRELQLFKRIISDDNNKNSLSNNEIRSICQDNTGGILWIGTGNGLTSFDINKNEYKRYFVNTNTKNASTANVINSVIFNSSDQLWVGTGNGFYFFNIKEGAFSKIQTKNAIPLNITVNIVFQDKSGLLWIGTNKGLIKVNIKPVKFMTYKSSETLPYKFSSNDITCIYPVDKDKFLVGTGGGGLNILNRKSASVISHDLSTKGNEENNFVNCICKYKNDQYFLGTNNGIFIYDEAKNTVSNLGREHFKGLEHLIQNKVNSLYSDNNNNVWAGTVHGLILIDMRLKKIKSWLNDPEVGNSIANNLIYCIAPDVRGKLWIGTDNGLDCLEDTSGIFKHFLTDKKGNQLFTSNVIYSLNFDNEGYIWIGTASGLNRFNPENGSVRMVTQRDGLSDNLIYSILIDKNQNLWVSTNKGINFIKTKTFQIRSFDVSDGLQDFEFNFNSAYASPSGELFFGGVAGLNSCIPDSLPSNSYIPPLEITSIEIITSKSESKFDNLSSGKIVIPYRTNTFTINFSALDFTFPEKNLYAYKFYSGDEKNWIYIGNKHTASFSNLQPGEYNFKVIGSNNDMVWNNKGLSLLISVDSPFWLKTKAFYLYGFFICISLFGIYRFRTYNLRKSNKILKDKEMASTKIESQREQLAVKNKNITDSINYAKRIQVALMPSEKSFRKIVPESFVFHKPKDIVSGDFFWISENGNKVYIAAVDCTGHGVPGAFMSIIGFELFRKITHSQGINDPSQILNILNKEFELIFKDVENQLLRDGMDIAFCVIDKETKILEFSGAVNPIYLIRDNKITEIRGSRFSVGLEDEIDQEQSFENKQFVLLENDVIYLFTDGYADQFGGPEGKKFKYRRFRHLLLTIHQYPMDEQKKLLEERENLWQGSLEQVDDILVIGFKPVFG